MKSLLPKKLETVIGVVSTYPLDMPLEVEIYKKDARKRVDSYLHKKITQLSPTTFLVFIYKIYLFTNFFVKEGDNLQIIFKTEAACPSDNVLKITKIISGLNDRRAK